MNVLIRRLLLRLRAFFRIFAHSSANCPSRAQSSLLGPIARAVQGSIWD